MLRVAQICSALVFGLTLTIPQPAAAQDTELAGENFQQADVDGDGALEYSEFVTFIDLNAADGLGNAARVSSRNLHARAFDRLNTNGDGMITPEELQRAPD